MGPRDPALHWIVRLLSGVTLVLFLFALLALNFLAFAGAIWAGAMTYILIRVDVGMHPKSADPGTRIDEAEEPTADAESRAIYSLQAAGIPLTYERRSRKARKKG